MSLSEALTTTVPSPFPREQLHQQHTPTTNTTRIQNDVHAEEDPFSDERAVASTSVTADTLQSTVSVSYATFVRVAGVSLTVVHLRT